jgi:hypothetical protein
MSGIGESLSYGLPSQGTLIHGGNLSDNPYVFHSLPVLWHSKFLARFLYREAKGKKKSMVKICRKASLAYLVLNFNRQK